MSYFNKDKKSNNWDQSLRSGTKTNKPKRIRRSLQYLLVLKKFNGAVDYKNVKLLKAFLNKYGKIRPRRKTRISVQQQRLISKAIRKSRSVGIIPIKCDVKI
jgi:small subunit ribosomal protein S18